MFGSSKISKKDMYFGSRQYKWEVFKNGPNEFCGRQSLERFIWSILKYFISHMMELSTKIVNVF